MKKRAKKLVLAKETVRNLIEPTTAEHDVRIPFFARKLDPQALRLIGAGAEDGGQEHDTKLNGTR